MRSFICTYEDITRPPPFSEGSSGRHTAARLALTTSSSCTNSLRAARLQRSCACTDGTRPWCDGGGPQRGLHDEANHSICSFASPFLCMFHFWRQPYLTPIMMYVSSLLGQALRGLLRRGPTCYERLAMAPRIVALATFHALRI